MNNHQVAVIIANLLGDDCACNINNNDEWLPKYCEFANTCCPNPVGVACWEQYLKHLDKQTSPEEERHDRGERENEKLRITGSSSKYYNQMRSKTMVDAHKVMKGIVRCTKHNCYGCPYWKDYDWQCITDMQKDALELIIDLIGERRGKTSEEFADVEET